MSMSYIDDKGGARKYTGKAAAGYDAKRENSQKWQEEDRIITDYLSTVTSGATVLDVPVGTGRFIPYCVSRQFDYWGVDVSIDMLDQAKKKIPDELAGARVRLAPGNILELHPGYFDGPFHTSMMIRLTRWLSPEECVHALRVLQALTTDRIIFTARVANHPHARPYELIDAALDGWKIYKDEPAGDENYRVIQLRKV